MGDPRRASEYRLADGAAAALEQLLRREGERVWAGLAAAAPRGPVCLLALSTGAMHPAVAEATALTEAARDRALRASTLRTGLEDLWDPWAWDVPDVVCEEALDGPIGAEEIAVDRALHDAGCEAPELAFLAELAWRLSREPEPPVATSADFACLVHDTYSGDDLADEDDRRQAKVIDAFRAGAPAEAVAAYAARGWLQAAAEAPVPRASALALDDRARERLAQLVATEAAVVWDAVARALGTTPVVAVGLVWADPELPTASYVAALSAARARTIGPDELWAAADWDHTDLLDTERADDTYARAAVVAADLEAAGADEPEEVFLHELAQALAHDPAPPGVILAEDFGAFAVEHEGAADGPAAFRSASRPEAVAAWERRGWLA